MRFCGVGSHHDNHVSIGNGRKVLRSCRLTQGLLQTITGWGVAYSSASIDVVVTKSVLTIFWTNHTSSFVQREDEIAPMLLVPYFS